ncbi:MAG: Holliday junction resolvase RuvX [Corallococcus sp.]|nr:Holliday junction resolvase RuvX [Corallococcus sp.]
MGKIIAIDVGDVRIGVAVSDILGVIANPLETYKRVGDIDADAKYIADLANKNQATVLVSGLPKKMNGDESLQTEKTRLFCECIAKYSDIKIVYIDERLTTVSAERLLIEGNVRRENRKKVIDKVAATIILQNYLDYYKR